MLYESESEEIVAIAAPKQNSKVRILIVDDQNFVRQTLCLALKPEPDFEIVGTAIDGENALEQIEMLRPNLALVDIEMPGMNGLTATQKIAQRFPATRVLILTSHNSQEYIQSAIRSGAKGYLLKATPTNEIADAIRFVMKGYMQLGTGLFQKAEYYQDRATDDRSSSNNEALVSATQLTSSLSTVDRTSPFTKELLDTLPQVWTRGLLYLLGFFTLIVIPWSILAKVDETGTARGRLEPKAKVTKLDAPVAGTVAVVKVKEGDTVKAGQVLAELESDVEQTRLKELQEKYLGQRDRLTKLELVKKQLILVLSTQKQENQAQKLEKLVQIEQTRQHFNALQKIDSVQKSEKLAQVNQAEQAIASSKATYKLAQITLAAAEEKVPRYRQAFQEGAISQDRLLEVEQAQQENYERLRQASSQIEQAKSRFQEQQSGYDKLTRQKTADLQQAILRLQEHQNNYESLINSGKLSLLATEKQLQEHETEINALKAEIAQTEGQIKGFRLELKKRLLKASADGMVFHIPIPGAGTVVQPGEPMMEIAPEKSPLVLRSQISTSESGSLKVGMPVKLKFDAYPFQDYGVVEGRVSWISPDSKLVEIDRGKLEVFELEIELEQPYIQGHSKQITLNPGQTATAEIILRQRRVIDFILDPFKKLQKGGLDL